MRSRLVFALTPHKGIAVGVGFYLGDIYTKVFDVDDAYACRQQHYLVEDFLQLTF